MEGLTPNTGHAFVHEPLRFDPKQDFCSTCKRWINVTDTLKTQLQQRASECDFCARNSLLRQCQCRVVTPLTESMNRYNANLPQLDTPKTFDNFKRRRGTEEALQATQDWAANQGKPLLFLNGTVGSGKSHLIEATIRWTLAQGHTARYEFVPGLLKLLRPMSIEGHDEKRAEAIYWCDNAKFLALDDIGVEKVTDFVNEQLTMLVDDCIRNGRRLITSTNLTPEQIKDRLGERLHSRLYGENTEVVRRVRLTCGDYRMGDS